MGRCGVNKLGWLVVLVVVVVAAEGAKTPPGIAKNPSNAVCKDPTYKECHNLVHVCPKFCPDSCTVNCQSCKPVCGPAPPTTPAPTPPTPAYPTPATPAPKPPTPAPTPPTPTYPTPPTPATPAPKPPTPATPAPTPPTPATPVPTPPTPTPPTPATPVPTPPTPTYPTPPTPATPAPKPPTPSPAPTPPTPSTPVPTPPTPTPPTPATPVPTPPTPTYPTPPTPATPAPTPPTPSTPAPTPPTPATPIPTPPTPETPVPTPPTPTPSTPSPTPPSPKKAKCTNKWYTKCYNSEHVCPSACPGGCEVDCVSCKPVCKCDKPGAVCQDPRFIGGDGITFYFHGKKDQDFCLVSDQNLHINGHFIGRRNQNMGRDFTWVQSIAILFGSHKLYLGALKTSAWDDSVDRLALSFDGQTIQLPEYDGAYWKSTSSPATTITRLSGTNNVAVEVEGSFKITAKVVPITEEESRVHNYGITKEDCYAHLDLGFKFLSLTNQVSGVLGQTYEPDYVSRVKIGANMPVMGGDRSFKTSGLFSPDCLVARFSGTDQGSDFAGQEMPTMNCASGIDGRGVVCKR